jgi:hypothetical protein
MNEFLVKVNGNRKQIKIIDDNFVEVDNVRMSYMLTELNSSNFILNINNNLIDIYL